MYCDSVTMVGGREEVSEDHGKEELTTVAAFLPWRGSPVRSPWPLTPKNLIAAGRRGNW